MGSLLILLFILLAAVVPTVFYVLLAYWLDRYEKEPLHLLIITFLWGAVPAIIVSLIFELIFEVPLRIVVTGVGADLVSAAVIAPMVEESAKAVPLVLIFLIFRHEFDGLMDGLIYGALVGFGFAMTENIFYYLQAAEEGLGMLSLLITMRGIVYGLNHALFTSAAGIGLAYARYTRSRSQALLAFFLGLAGAIFLHMAHNFLVSLGSANFILLSLVVDWGGALLWLALMWGALRVEKRWISEELGEEVASGLLSPDHATAAASYRARLRERWATVREHGFGRAHQIGEMHNAAAKLGVLKRQMRMHEVPDQDIAKLHELRNQIWAMRQELGEV
ncbi:MAG: PrsW family intramembrane metalloprotease [Ardenticatenales bacterium]|nr:PrsW family intramembrane metalloprotease [Ardenticatenales bacterium]